MSSSTAPLWLPPLNHHQHHYSIQLTASQDELPPKDPSSSTSRRLPQFFAIKVHVVVRFSTHSGSALGFEGLDYTTQQFFIPSRALIRSSTDKAEKILCSKLTQLNIPVRIRNVITFAHKHLGQDYSLFMDRNWVGNLQNFLKSMLTKTYNFRRNVLPLNLTIDKSVKIPDGQYKAWHCWYYYSRKMVPDFVKKYSEAISRPRTDHELLYEPILTFDQATKAVFKDEVVSDTCSICLEDLSDEKGGVNSISCGHFFHDHCIKQWFWRNPVCPLCRETLYLA